MTGSQIFSKLSEQAIEEHGLIRFHLDQLERALSDLDPATADAETLRTFAVRIDSFKERLDEHVGTEEEGGLLQGILDALPQTESDVRRIRTQHARLGEALERARAIARRGDPAEASALKDQLDRFLAKMREHEREEDELVKRAVRQG
jgi:hemerythrin-like domain-containing protein